MSGQLRLDDETLSQSGIALVTASYVMANENVARSMGQIDSVTGIGARVEHYLKGMSVARAALGDAAKTASLSVAMLMEESTVLDTFIGQQLASGFTLQKGKR